MSNTDTGICELTLEKAKAVLEEKFGGVLKSGSHDGPRDGDTTNCQVCVRELRAYACEMGWTDKPDQIGDISPTDRACQSLNDAAWSSDKARTEACIPLALISEHTVPEGWLKTFTISVIREIVPIALRAAASIHPQQTHKDALEQAARNCEKTPDAADAAYAAADAADAARAAADAADAAYAAADAAYAAADAAYAAYAAAGAARAAAYAAYAAADAARAARAAFKKDSILRLGVNLLLKAHGREDLCVNTKEEE